MQLRWVVGIVAALVSVLSGYSALRAAPQALANRLFAVIAGLLAVWALAFAGIAVSPDEASALFWYRVGIPAWTLTPALLVGLVVSVERRWLRRLPPWALPLLVLPGCGFLLRAYTGPMLLERMVPAASGWEEVPAQGPWVVLFSAYLLGYVALGFAGIARWRIHSSARRVRRQATVVIVSGLAAVAAAFLSNILLPVLGIHWGVGYAPIYAQLFVLGIGFSMAHYRLMTPAAVAEDMLDTLSEGVLLVNDSGELVRVNRAARASLRLTAASAWEGERLATLLPEVAPLVEESLRAEASDEARIEDRELTVARADTGPLDVNVSAMAVRDPQGDPQGCVVILRDVSERKRAERELQRLANHDVLTGLPNRLLLHDRLEQALARSRRSGASVGVLLLDLDRFKEVNDSLGHGAGDELLRSVAERVSEVLREYDTFARMGGDEFVVVLSDLVNVEGAETVAERILRVFDRPFQVVGQALHMSCSLGLALFPRDAAGSEDLLQQADIAMYAAKGQGRNAWRRFVAEMLHDVQRRASVERDLRGACARGELRLHYQPLVDLARGRVSGLEALLRWQHPTRGLLGPGEFLSVAEASGILIEIGRWVLREACRQARAWRDEGLAAVPVSVNLSPAQLKDSALLPSLREALESAALSADALVIEVTEGALAGGYDAAAEVLRRLAELGFRISVDDFGAGHSSLSRLRRLPIHQLKIDRQFVRDIASDGGDAAIVAAVAALGHSLGLEVVVEGVERPEQLEALRGLRLPERRGPLCDHVQGYLLGRPMPPEQICEELRRGSLGTCPSVPTATARAGR